MVLSDCKYGVLVAFKEEEHIVKVGMVVGITNNRPLESHAIRRDPANAVPLVQWSSGETYPVHPGLLELL